MPGSPSPFVAIQYFDNNGDPADSYQLFTYDAGTTTKRNTFTDYDLTVANTNPIILDSAGRATIFLSPVLYKFVLASPTDIDPPSSPIWTRDNVVPSAGVSNNVDVAVTAGESLAAGDCCYLSDGSGGNTAGRWYKTDADQTYSSNAAYMFGFATAAITSATTGTVRIGGRVTGLSGLTAGTPYFVSATAGGLTSTAPTNAVMVGKADSTTSLILPIVWGDAGAAVRGVVSSSTQTFGGQKTFVLQPQTYIGAAVTLPATVGGVFFVDVTQRIVTANQTDLAMSSTSIPANMLNANGKAVRVRLMSNTTSSGTNLKLYELRVGSTDCTLYSETAATVASSDFDVMITRQTSTTALVSYIGVIESGSPTAQTDGTNLTGLDFTAEIGLSTRGTTGATSTITQDVFIAEAVG